MARRGRSEGSIYQQADGRWVAAVSVGYRNGKRKRKRIYGSTRAAVAKELKREVPGSSPHAEDIDLLISQAARCREILSRLSNREQAADHVYANVKLSAMLEDLVAPLRGSDVVISIDCAPESRDKNSPEPVFRRNPAIAYGLSNILENAIDFARSAVTVRASWTRTAIQSQVSSVA